MRFLAFAMVMSAVCGRAIAADAAKPVSYVCSFPKMKMTLTFVMTELKPESFTSATLVGNAGTSTVLAYLGDAAVSFLEPLATGVVQSTTIQLSTLDAVHSRHTIMGFDGRADFMPSQSTGKCELRD